MISGIVLSLIILVILGIVAISLFAAVVSMLKLPLAIVAGLITFMYLPKILQDKLDVDENTSLLFSGVGAFISTVVLYTLQLFWLVIATAFLVVIYFVFKSFLGVQTDLGIFDDLVGKELDRIKDYELIEV